MFGVWAAVGVGVAGGLATGQPSRSAWPQFREVEPGFGDVDPLRVGQREISLYDQRQPVGFHDLYELSGFGGERVYARRSGAVTALFPRSVYAQTRQGDVALIPPGTVFVIGEPDPRTLEQFGITGRSGSGGGGTGGVGGRTQAPSSPLAVDLSVPMQAGPAPVATAPSTPGPGAAHATASKTAASAASRTAGNAAQPTTGAGQQRAPEPIGIFLDEDYRQRRVTELMQIAARAAVRRAR